MSVLSIFAIQTIRHSSEKVWQTSIKFQPEDNLFKDPNISNNVFTFSMSKLRNSTCWLSAGRGCKVPPDHGHDGPRPRAARAHRPRHRGHVGGGRRARPPARVVLELNILSHPDLNIFTYQLEIFICTLNYFHCKII